MDGGEINDLRHTFTGNILLFLICWTHFRNSEHELLDTLHILKADKYRNDSNCYRFGRP